MSMRLVEERRRPGDVRGSAGPAFPAVMVALGLGLVLAAAAPSSALGQTVRGHLLESGTERPVTLGHVALMDTSMTMVAETFSDHEGWFEVTAPEPGDYWVLADRLGYDPVLDGVIELGEDGVLPVEIRMILRVVQLEGLTVTAHRQRIDQQLDNAGFWEREEKGFGKFISPDDIARRPSLDVPQLLRDIPGVRFATGGIGGSIPYMRDRGSGANRFDEGVPPGYCRPRIFVNGMQTSTDPRHEEEDEDGSVLGYNSIPIEEMVDVQDVVAVEVYPGGATLPFQWNSLGSCGVILFWTDGGG